MNKLNISIVFLIGLTVFVTYSYFNNKSETKDNSAVVTTKLSQEEIDDYIRTTLQASFVKYLRKTFDKYIADDVSFKKSIVYESQMIADQKCGLKSFDTTYYRSKFNVASVETHPGGGVEVNIIFVSKPDKVFTVWIYGEEPNWEMRSFCEVGLDEETIQVIKKDYSQYLDDPRLSI